MLFKKQLPVAVLLLYFGQIVNASIDFNHELGFSTVKINDVDTNDMLSQESQAITPIIAKRLPKLLLCLRRFVAQSA